MRMTLMLILSLAVLAVLNYGIYEKEYIKRQGETVLLELAPVDPRSLMQGDFMRLRYKIAQDAPISILTSNQSRGYMVIRLDENQVAQFVRFHAGERLSAEEKLLRFHRQYSSAQIVPDSFLFQEGHAEYYEVAKYGIFKFHPSGNHLLIGLADENRVLISPP